MAAQAQRERPEFQDPEAGRRAAAAGARQAWALLHEAACCAAMLGARRARALYQARWPREESVGAVPIKFVPGAAGAGQGGPESRDDAEEQATFARLPRAAAAVARAARERPAQLSAAPQCVVPEEYVALAERVVPAERPHELRAAQVRAALQLRVQQVRVPQVRVPQEARRAGLVQCVVMAQRVGLAYRAGAA